MKTRQNLHTHSRYCDGQNTLREMIDAALYAGLTSLGFSTHAWCGEHGRVWTATPEGVTAYFSEMARLKDEYAGRITLYAGLEIDATLPLVDQRSEYVIGSLHHFPIPGGWGHVDDTPERLQEGIDALGGDPMDMARAYYGMLARFAIDRRPDILGHFDLLTKFNSGGRFLDTASAPYRRVALEALEAIAKTGTVFEVNTGAVARGYTKAPYLEPFLLKRLLELKAPVTISSDAHFPGGVVTHFEQTEALLREIGFTSQVQFNGKTFDEVSL